MSWALRLPRGSLHTAFGRERENTVAALREGRRPPSRGLPSFPDIPTESFVSALDAAAFTATSGGVREALRAVAQAALANLASPEAWLLAAGSGTLFLGACAGDTGAWLGCDGDIADDLAQDLGLTAPPLTLSTACSSTANALLLAGQAVARDEYPSALVVGFEGVSHIVLEGFKSLMLLDEDGCRPFDRDRDGLHLGEAIAAQGVECLPTLARQKGAVLLGGAHVCAAMGPAAQAPDAEAMYAVMAQALKVAGREPGDVVAIKSHGLGSMGSDRAEAQAMHRLYAALPPVTSLKGALGHTLAASGVLETVAFTACLEAGFIPPAVGFAEADPSLDVHPLQAPLPVRDGCYQLNFFGFGASYVSLVVAWNH